MRKRKFCNACGKYRSDKNFLDGMEFCAACSLDEIIQTYYKKCSKCLVWKENCGDGKSCLGCRKIALESSKKYKRKNGIRENGKIITCKSCEKEKNLAAFYKSEEICRQCIKEKKEYALGRVKCKKCRCYRDINCFGENTYCPICLEKSKRKWERDKEKRDSEEYREKQRKRVLKYYHKNKEFRRQYRRYYYYNIWKPFYNKMLHLQWIYGIQKKRRVNRDGYWWCLNRQMFNGLRQSQWRSQIEKIAHAYLHKPGDLEILSGIPQKKYEDMW